MQKENKKISLISIFIIIAVILIVILVLFLLFKPNNVKKATNDMNNETNNNLNSYIATFYNNFGDKKVVNVNSENKIIKTDIPDSTFLPEIKFYDFDSWRETNDRETEFDFDNTLIDKNLNFVPQFKLKDSKDEPFFMPIEDFYELSTRGVVITGKIIRGTVKIGDVLQINCKDGIREVVVTAIEAKKEVLTQAAVGKDVGICLKNIKKEEVEVGQIAIAKDSVPLKKQFNADIYLLTQEEGGKQKNIDLNSDDINISFFGQKIECDITLDPNVVELEKGKKYSAVITLKMPMPLEEQYMFSIRKDISEIGKGIINIVND